MYRLLNDGFWGVLNIISGEKHGKTTRDNQHMFGSWSFQWLWPMGKHNRWNIGISNDPARTVDGLGTSRSTVVGSFSPLMDCNRRNARIWQRPAGKVQPPSWSTPRSNHQPPAKRHSSSPWRRPVAWCRDSSNTDHGIQGMMVEHGWRMLKNQFQKKKAARYFETWFQRMTCPFRHAQFEVMCQNSKLNIQGLAPCTCSQFQVSNCVQLSKRHPLGNPNSCLLEKKSLALHSQHGQDSLYRYTFIILQWFPSMFWLQIRLKPNIKKSTARGANENAKPDQRRAVKEQLPFKV